MKIVLVTGASGFIGRHALPFLRKAGYEVHAVFSKSHPADQVHWHQTDLLSQAQATALLEKIRPTHLLHFAWYAEHGKFWNSPLNLSWTEASLHLLHEFIRLGGKRFVGAGTCAEYEWAHEIYSEETACRSDSLYGTCKAALHQIAEKYCKQSNVSCAWGRIFHLFGPHESPTRFIAFLIQKLLKKETVPCSHGEQIRDFLHVEDVAHAFVALLSSPVEGAINIASGKGVKLKEISQLLGEKLQGSELIQLGALQTPHQDLPSLVANTQRLSLEVGWQPTHTLEERLMQTIDWWRAHV